MPESWGRTNVDSLSVNQQTLNPGVCLDGLGPERGGGGQSEVYSTRIASETFIRLRFSNATKRHALIGQYCSTGNLGRLWLRACLVGTIIAHLLKASSSILLSPSRLYAIGTTSRIFE
jgi:hypothetical protein